MVVDLNKTAKALVAVERKQRGTPAPLSFVQVQTLRGTQGIAAAFTEVQNAVKAHNAANPKSPAHVAVKVSAVPANTKGMQWKLATLATLARQHDATMIRLNVHMGEVAICGTPAAVKATQDALVPTCNALGTMVANAYDAGRDGNRVGFTNAWLCGAPAGIQTANKITAAIAYGIGFLFSFPAPGSGVAYAMGQTMAASMASVATAPKTTRTTRTPKTATATAPNAELDLLNAQEHERDSQSA